MSDENTPIDADDDALAVVHALIPNGDGFLAALEVSAQTVAASTTRLLGFDAKGAPSGDPADHPMAEPTDLPVLARLPAPESPLFAWFDGVRAHVGATESGQERLAALLDSALDGDRGAVAEIAAGDGFVALLCEARDARDATVQSLHVVNAAAKKPILRRVDLTPLELTPSRAITALALRQGGLYLAVSDPVAGFEIHRLNPARPGTAPVAITSRGDFRFAVNGAVTRFCPGPGGLLIGTAALASGPVTPGNWGPELLRLTPDDRLEILFGQQRFTPSGLKRPLSGQGPGLGAPDNAAIKAICRGRVAGQDRVFVVLQDFLGDPQEARDTVQPDLFAYYGDAAVYGSGDLLTWQRIDPDLPEDFGAITSACVADGRLVLGHEGLGRACLPLTFVTLD